MDVVNQICDDLSHSVVIGQMTVDLAIFVTGVSDGPDVVRRSNSGLKQRVCF